MLPTSPTSDSSMIKSYWQKAVNDLGLPLVLGLLLAAGFMAFTAWDHSHWWMNREDYGFGWLVPIFVGFVVRDRWPQIVAAAKACQANPSARMPGWLEVTMSVLVYGVMLGGALMFLLGAFYRAGAGPSNPGSLALSLGTGALVLSLIWINAPEAPAKRPVALTEDSRFKLTLLFLFPALVWLVSAPMISLMENQLSLFLLRKVMTVVFFIFEVLGLPLEQEGNVLVLPPVIEGVPNRVGVEQACSGIRSLTGCLFAGSFLAAVFLDKIWKKVALVGAAMCFAFLTNLLRSLFLTSWAYNYGHEAIEGLVHDIAGFAVLGLTVVGLLLLLPLFQIKWVTGSGSDHDD